MLNNLLSRIRRKASMTFFPTAFKEKSELEYWQQKLKSQGTLSNDHYVQFYTDHFGLTPDSYADKRVMDIGCGPRGSLEWADKAAERIGLDPLAEKYLELGAADHQMKYVASGAEKIPFDDGYFDIVCSFNSLDHVADLQKSIKEITRVIKPGGMYLLLTDVNHDPTPCEPVSFSWDIVESFQPAFKPVEIRHYEKKDAGMYTSLRQNIPYDEADSSKRYGILSAKLIRQ